MESAQASQCECIPQRQEKKSQQSFSNTWADKSVCTSVDGPWFTSLQRPKETVQGFGWNYTASLRAITIH